MALLGARRNCRRWAAISPRPPRARRMYWPERPVSATTFVGGARTLPTPQRWHRRLRRIGDTRTARPAGGDARSPGRCMAPGRTSRVFADHRDPASHGSVSRTSSSSRTHWADEATLDLIRHVGRRVHGCRALVMHLSAWTQRRPSTTDRARDAATAARGGSTCQHCRAPRFGSRRAARPCTS